MKVNYYGTIGDEIPELEKANRRLSRRAAAESFVLLKNDHALPLKDKKIALYGIGARKTVKGGLGSGSVEERYSVTIEEGMVNAGYEITTGDWLDDYDHEYETTYSEWHAMVESKLVGLTNPMQIIPLAHSYVYRYPSGRLISAQDIEKSNTDTAIYVITRQAGECNDRRLEKGDYLITDEEHQNLKILASSYEHTILIINVGGMIDLSFLEEIEGIDAVVSFVQGGEEGGNALADVLSGRQNFSGKLTSTWQNCYEDVPGGENFSYLDGDLMQENYIEGIYVGYRYYDTFKKSVRYPFGFGLSYTQFEVQVKGVRTEKTNIISEIYVKNTGDTYSGKEVVQLYLSAPRNGLQKEYQSLATFFKTSELAPGADKVFTVEFDLTDMCSYDAENSRWVLDAGNYVLRVGNHSRNTQDAAVIQLKERVITKQCKTCCAPEQLLSEITVPVHQEEEALPTDLPILQIGYQEFQTIYVDYTEPEVDEREAEREILDALTIEEISEFLRGGALRNPPKGAFEILGAGGKTTTALLHKGIRNVIFSDGPAGVNITNRVCFCEDDSVKPVQIPERYNWGILAKTAAERLISIDGQIVNRYATAWPVEMLLAQSWNTELLTQIGTAVGEEMKLFGITLWLAPGMNIHRNPLCGRNFEYYSEDPLISGKMAAAITRGVQSQSAVGTTIKHFCCNNSEDNRCNSNSNINERALREIYLKGFEVVVKESQPLAVMSSYNMLNGTYTPNRHDLLTDILRCEWGFEGMVMTDWGSCDHDRGKLEQCAVAGNDLIMPGCDADREKIRAAMKAGELDDHTIRKSAVRVLRIMLQANTPVLEK
ncbi:MAG: glycoside hydrolase family 3 protein [Suipraeoptans sp.]